MLAHFMRVQEMGMLEKAVLTRNTYVDYERCSDEVRRDIVPFTDWMWTQHREFVDREIRSSKRGPIWNYCVEHCPDLLALWRLTR